MSTTELTTARHRIPTITRILSLFGAVLLASAFLVVGTTIAPAAAAPVSQCDGLFNGGGEGANCQITVENTLNLATGAESSTVTTLVCSGAANTVSTCAGPGTVVVNDFLTDVVEQCNGSGDGGGSTLQCSVVMTNTIIGAGTTSAPSVNQCNDSFDSLPLPAGSSCDPIGATTDATITQCNDSINCGTQVSMNCTVGSSTVSSALPVSITQCNNSVNGGGALLECSTSITTLFVPADDEGGDTAVPSPDELAETGVTAPLALLAVPLAALLLGSLLVATTVARRRELLTIDS